MEGVTTLFHFHISFLFDFFHKIQFSTSISFQGFNLIFIFIFSHFHLCLQTPFPGKIERWRQLPTLFHFHISFFSSIPFSISISFPCFNLIFVSHFYFHLVFLFPISIFVFKLHFQERLSDGVSNPPCSWATGPTIDVISGHGRTCSAR